MGIGDGQCDDGNNIAACSYDGGDCCGDSVSMIYCSICQCLDPNSYYYSYSSGSYGSSSCQDSWIGDGQCDDGNNIAACSYDGGDCCGDSVGMSYCSICQCLDPGYVSYSSGSYGSSGSYDYGSSGSYVSYDYGSSGSCQDAWIGD